MCKQNTFKNIYIFIAESRKVNIYSFCFFEMLYKKCNSSYNCYSKQASKQINKN